MKNTFSLIAAPTAPQPGGYIAKAYEDRTTPGIAQAELGVEPAAGGKGWTISLSWACPNPVQSIVKETDKFLDCCALLVPTTEDGQWISMGEPGKAVEGVLWKADRERPWRMHAEGLPVKVLAIYKSAVTIATTVFEYRARITSRMSPPNAKGR